MHRNIKIFLILILLIFVSFGAWKIYIKSTLLVQSPQLIENREQMVFIIDNSFSYNQIHKIESALTRWEKVTNSDVSFITISTDTSNDMKIWTQDKVATIYNANSILHWPWHVGQFLSHNSVETVGLTNIITCDIFIFQEDSDLFEQIITHEVGHVLGLEHVNDKNNIMYPFVSPNAKQITAQQIYTIDLFITMLPYIGRLQNGYDNISE